jgi:acetyltransferase
LISQSGAIAAAMVGWGAEKSVGFSGVVSIGDQLDVDVADLLDYFALDDKTQAILLYIEAISDARKFMSAARAAARLKPAGRMSQGAKAAATHTGALAGSDAVYDAAFRRAGLLRIFDLRELFDCAELLGRRVRAPDGNRLAILTNGGGHGILAVDRLAELGGLVAPLSEDTAAKLDAVLPPTWSKGNPVDIAGDADAARYLAALDILLADPASDALLVMNVETAVASASSVADAVADRIQQARDQESPSHKPVLAAWVGDQSAAPVFDKAAIAHFPTEDDAVRAFMYLVKHRETMEALMATPPDVSSLFRPNVDAARTIVGTALSEGRSWLDPIEIADLFKAYDIPIVPTLAASGPDEAAALAESFLAQELAVAIKILSRDITHKSDVGGVVLGLTTKEKVRDAAAHIIAKAKHARPEARIDGVMIQPMIVRPRARTDPRHRRRSDLRTGDRVRPRRHRGRDHQRQGAGAAATRHESGTGSGRQNPGLATAVVLPRRAGRAARCSAAHPAEAVADGGRSAGDTRARHQSAAGGPKRRAGARCACRHPRADEMVRRTDTDCRPALSNGMGARTADQGWREIPGAPDAAG